MDPLPWLDWQVLAVALAVLVPWCWILDDWSGK